jgi:hypothetical protein
MKAVFCITGFCALVCLVSTSPAVLTEVSFEDLPEQDPLVGPNLVHELGNSTLFPPEEFIEARYELTERTACYEFPGDNPFLPNALVYMTNWTGQKWTQVWYVADGKDPFVPQETSLTNYDGRVNGALAFQIDYFGMNRPLIYESMGINGIFEPGETWGFIIQDYQNQWQLPPSALGSIGVPSFNEPTAVPLSSGSIIAIPEPMTLALLGLGGLLVRRR